jgi:hypothetical protein
MINEDDFMKEHEEGYKAFGCLVEAILVILIVLGFVVYILLK